MEILEENSSAWENWERTVMPIVSELLSVLDDGMKALGKKKLFSNVDRMTAYTQTYKLASDSDDLMKDRLYMTHESIICDYLTDRMLPKLKDKHGEAMLRSFVERWQLFAILNRWMGHFFGYLNRYHVTYKNVATLEQQGLTAFRTRIFDQVKDRVTAAYIQVLATERLTGMLTVEMNILTSCTQIYNAMGASVYETSLEQPFLEEVSAFYAKESQDWQNSEFLIKLENAIEAEARRVFLYLVPSTDPKVRKGIAETLLNVRGPRLMEDETSGFRAMLRQDKMDDLARAYRIFLLLDDGVAPLARILREHIVAQGKIILDKREAELIQAEAGKESGNDAAFIQSLLELYEHYNKMVEIQFQNHRDCQKELKSAFDITVNADVGKHSNAELLSAFADSVLKTGGEEKLTDSQIEDVLEKVVALFSFLSDKDVFADVYRNYLAKRLLNQRSVSQFAEKSMISKLKLRCGAHFTSKFEGMLSDFAMCEDLQKSFTTWVGQNPASKPQIDFSCEVLTTGHWPSFRAISPQLPPNFAQCLAVFGEFYQQNKSHRKLTWVHSLGNVTIRAQFKLTYDLQLTTLQGLCLLIFNGVKDSESLTFSQINERLGRLEVDVTKRILHSLSCQKVRVLKKSPEGKRIDETDSFSVVTDFQSKIRKIRIPMASLDETHNHLRIEEDRGLAIEAAIVRIMKARKRLLHNHLVTEVMSQLRTFTPAPKAIKKKIEHLIEREYLVRDETEANVYKYLA